MKTKEIVLICLVAALLIAMCSCASRRTGYGCKGKSKIITRVR
jgi:hypothetical protein